MSYLLLAKYYTVKVKVKVKYSIPNSLLITKAQPLVYWLPNEGPEL